MADTARAQKIADRIKTLTAENLESIVKDPDLGFVTITDVRVTGDLQHASLFYTVFGDAAQRAQTARLLELQQGQAALVRRQAARHPAHPEPGVHRRRDPRDRRPPRGPPQRGQGARRGGGRRRGRRRPRRRRRPLQEGPRADDEDDADGRRATEAEAPVPTPDSGGTEPTPDGILVVDKPQGWTSHDVVARARRLCAHPQGRPRRHPRPDGDRGARARRRPGDPAAHLPRRLRQGLHGHDPARPDHADRRRRGGGHGIRAGAVGIDAGCRGRGRGRRSPAPSSRCRAR